MSNKGDKTCPLCVEEMDLTDQQLKPCKCGYEICVWCWHQIMGMAEKDDTEGRCPACRNPYDKEKIVGMAANCERMVAEVNMERKKLQKSKTKFSEGRKQLSSMRVIQRNLVYIIGLPLTLADEDLLQRREYFGQYGKVLKVSLSRTAAGIVQQFPNNTCSVYITYSKEEEAIRCIQSVHGFVLDGRSLKVCFGTTKYCHAWLRNVPCTNPDCLYLHEAGSQEDSFTKDEIISVYTRSRVQQITGVINSMLGRSGSMLPPPVDDYVHNTSTSAADPIVKSASKSAAVTGRGSPPNSSSGRSMGLPPSASWGTRPSNLPQTVSSKFLNGPLKPKHETTSGTLAFSTAVVGITQASTLQIDIAKKTSWIEENQIIIGEGNSDTAKPVKQLVAADSWPTVLDKEVTENGFSNAMLNNQASSPLPSSYIECGTAVSQNCLNSHVYPLQDGISLKEGSAVTDGQIQNFSEASLPRVESIGRNEFSGVSQTSNFLSEHSTLKSQGSQVPLLSYREQYRKPSNLQGADELASNGICSYGDQSVWGTDPQAKAVADAASEAEEDVLMFDNRRLKDPEVATRPMCLPSLVNPPGDSILSRSHSLQHGEVLSHTKANADNLYIENRVGDSSLNHSSKIVSVPNGYTQKSICSCIGGDKNLESSIFPNDRHGKQVDRVQSDADSNASFDIGESSIISNLLLLDLDSLDDSLTSPHYLVNLLRETDKQSTSLRLPTPQKLQTSNQSRFSFARQEESTNKAIEVDSTFGNSAQLSRNPSFSRDYGDSSSPYVERCGLVNGFSSEHDTFTNGPSALPSIKPSTVSRGQISAPPGFSAPNRTPPPGFSSHQRIDMDSNYDILSGNYLLDSSSIPRNLYQAPPTGSFSNTGDTEFIDPAILAVGKGRIQGGLNHPVMEARFNLPQQLTAFENEERLRLLMQGSLSSRQNTRHPDVRHGFSSLADSFGLSTRLLDQPQVNNLSPFSQLAIQQSRNILLSNELYDDWNEVQVGSNLGMVELLRNERRGFNKFYNSGYEESKFRMPSSADLYNRTFEM